MLRPLLTTKIYLPPPRPDRVARPHLLERLDEGLHLGRRLTLVAAPAGFGKTTLVSEWISGGTRPVAWLMLDEGDNDPPGFAALLVAALAQIDPHLGQTAAQLLRSTPPPPLHTLAVPLINDLMAIGAAPILVLDDYHVIHSPPIHEFLTTLIDHLPPGMHVVIATREDPPLPLARLRVRGHITEIRARDLRFTEDEAAQFLNQRMRLALSPEAIAALEARTEGWIAGLQLAALAMQQDPTRAEAFVADFTGDDRYVMDYLVSEVLAHQPETLRAFLLQTAILERLCAPLCDAVTERDDSRALLDQLDKANLFLVPLDHRREWYRYHHLFAEFLRARLPVDAHAPLHRRAMAWYEANGLLPAAIHHALAADDRTEAGRLIRLAAEPALFGGSLTALRGWLDALPAEDVRADAPLALIMATLLALSGDVREADDYARAIDAAALDSTGRAQLLTVEALLALTARTDYARVATLASSALVELPESAARWRLIALWTLAEAQKRIAPVSRAIASLRTAGQLAESVASPLFEMTVVIAQAFSLNYHGARREALARASSMRAGAYRRLRR